MEPPLPVHLPDLHGGLTELKGVLYLEDEFLVLEIDTLLLGEFSQEEQVIKIEPAALADVRLDRGLVRDRLCLRPKKRTLLEAVPGKHRGGEVQLRVWRTRRAQAEQLVEQVRRRQAIA